MKLIKLVLCTCILCALIFFLNKKNIVQGIAIPPLGHFLSPETGFWANVESDSFPYPSNPIIPGLKDEVCVHYDVNGIPHIIAKNDLDLYKAQGYIVAQHRLWQMDFQTRAAAGRLSEILGDNEQILNYDRLQRRKGIVFGAKKILQSFKEDKELWSFLNAYCEGVNTYISNLSYKELPVEYKLIDYRPEPWTPLKSALLLEYMIDNLTGWDNDLESTNAYHILGPDVFNKLFPQWTGNIDPVVDNPDTTNFHLKQRNTPGSLVVSKTMMKAVHEMPDPDNGSNNWAVSDWKTKNNKAILASDMHLGLNAPPLWFLIQLTSPNVNVSGFALTGSLGIVAGHNDNIAWGFTDVSKDERDWYAIEFRDDTRSEYKYGESYRKTEKVIEEIKVKGSDTFIDTVIYTHHGPVLYDNSFMSENQKHNLSLKWIGHYPSRTQRALLNLNKASNHKEFEEALEYWDSPSQHVVFASTAGDVGINVQGLWPMKFEKQGAFIMDGSNPDFEWEDFIPTALILNYTTHKEGLSAPLTNILWIKNILTMPIG